MSDYTFKKPNFRREIRLGLVVYGGVSLAIYMNGVCREFYNAVRGRGIYKLIKALTDSDIVVDIISGTSAGGINGVLLSYALANSNLREVVDFADFADIWRESGDILKLLREPSATGTKVESVLNGEDYYQNQLKEAFEKGYYNKRSAPPGEWVSDFNELDLFVTGTDVLGRIYKTFDDTGSVIEIKDHRAVFQLKHRRGRKEPFNLKNNQDLIPVFPEETCQALAKLCRITSCFPVAFPVVEVELKGNNRIDQKLVEWGQLDQREFVNHPQIPGYQLYFIDGGVLDNRPFSYTIKEMYYRTINRPVDRKLFYIDPSPDRFIDEDDFKNIKKPNTLQILQESLIGIPMYESIGNDLEAIKSHNEKVRRYKTLLADTQTPTDSAMATLEAIDIEETIYLRSRLISLRDRVLPLVLRMEQDFRINSEKKAYLDKAANILTDQITGEKEKAKQDKIRQAFEKQIRNLDIEYSLRKHFYLIQILCQRLETESNLIEYQKLRYLSESISRQIKLLEVIRAALNQLLSKPIVSDSFYQLLAQSKPDNQMRGIFYERLLRLHRFLLDAVGLDNFLPDTGSDLEEVSANIFQNLPLKATEPFYNEWLSQSRISSILLQFKQKINKLQSEQEIEQRIWKNSAFNYDYQENEYFETILRKVELASESLIATSQLIAQEEILASFQQFRYLDKVLYPFEYLMNLTEKELIETIRISPNDAKLGLGEGKTLEDKLAGDTLFAFGGFFKKSWRSNDILWGRLDGLNRIFEALLTPESVKKFPEFLERQGNCRRGTLEFESFTDNYLEFLLDESLPNILETQRNPIISYLKKLAYPEKLTEQQLQLTIDGLLRILVLEGHREIVSADLSNVLQDEIAEQLNWNRQRLKPNTSASNQGKLTRIEEEERPQYYPVAGYFERRVSALAAARLAEEAIINLSQGNSERFFREKYNVGQETVFDSIPRIILANILTQFALVLRNVVLTALGKRASILRKSLTYNIFDKSLQLFYGWLQFTGPLAVQTSKYRPIFLLFQLILLLVAIAGVAIVVWKSWVWVMIAISATLLFWLLEIIRKTSSRRS
ncbi:patatin-like protein [Allocoleopsis franciscana]|uniref:Patatin-related protein n=1 Tax=Allocoleopsis franciscana PCC 7113 TaxID=1173027 RepID=K9WHM0_9CYAN|nr:patatin-like protein [Allocoleopsis franciscana]AFZ19306.1 patatin-related protein [Allocoleopsis franciscana PCC 7113]